MDITTDGFGMMLAFGDLTWVPFTYTLQSRYLVHHDPHLSNMYLFVIIVFKICGSVLLDTFMPPDSPIHEDPASSLHRGVSEDPSVDNVVIVQQRNTYYSSKQQDTNKTTFGYIQV